MINKKKVVFVAVIFFLIIGVIAISTYLYKDFKKEQKEDAEALTLKSNLKVEFASDVKVSDFIDNLKGTLIDDYEIDTTSLGKKEIKIEYKSIRNKNKKKSFEIEVIDTTKPIITMGKTMTVNVGYTKKLEDVIFSADNCDSNPMRTIEGEYDFNKVGEYKLIFKIEDASGNSNSQNFTLNVIKNKASNSNKTTTTTAQGNYINFSDAITRYKKSNTKIGIDVSKWQGSIDWLKVKNAGAEFAILRIGYQDGYNRNIEIDPYFKENFEKAKENGLLVGLYFNSYAKTLNEVREQAKWVIDTLSGEKLDLPVSFDWENWSTFPTCKMSIYDLNNLAKNFIEIIKSNGLTGSLYGSKNYLENIWYNTKYENIWLANYTSKTEYKGSYKIWQFTNTGKISGISGYVDIDVLY